MLQSMGLRSINAYRACRGSIERVTMTVAVRLLHFGENSARVEKGLMGAVGARATQTGFYLDHG